MATADTQTVRRWLPCIGRVTDLINVIDNASTLSTPVAMTSTRLPFRRLEEETSGPPAPAEPTAELVYLADTWALWQVETSHVIGRHATPARRRVVGA